MVDEQTDTPPDVGDDEVEVERARRPKKKKKKKAAKSESTSKPAREKPSRPRPPAHLIDMAALVPLQVASMVSVKATGHKLVYLDETITAVQQAFKAWMEEQDFELTPGWALVAAYGTAVAMANREPVAPAPAPSGDATAPSAPAPAAKREEPEGGAAPAALAAVP